MGLLAGQTWNTSCPYLWGHCNGSTCDGCDADKYQGVRGAEPPWAQGPTVSHRHAKVREAAEAADNVLANELWGSFSGWRE